MATDPALAGKSRSAKRRDRKRNGNGSTIAAAPVAGTAVYSRAQVASAASPVQSPAELLELLAGQVPRATIGLGKAASHARPPIALFPTGAPAYHEGPIDSDFAALLRWSPEEIGENQERSEKLMAMLENPDQLKKKQLVAWLSKSAMPLALSKHGTRVIQKALEVASSADRDALVAALGPFVEQLYDSPHGNYVLTKIVEVMPSAAIGFLIAQLMGKGPAVARHRFGCRVLERLIEHCDQSQIGELIDEIVLESGSLCHHNYGNFVVQHLIEHSPTHRSAILANMLEKLPELASHRTASHAVQKILDCSGKDGQFAIVAKLLEAESPHTLAEISCNRYGSFVVEQIAGMMKDESEEHSREALQGIEVKKLITASREELSQSPFGVRVLQTFGDPFCLAPLGEAPTSSSGTSKL